MKLYYSPGACSMAPHIALNETGIKFESESVDLGAKKTKSGKEFSTINPKGYVPALQLDNGQLLTEVSTLLQYVADQKPELQLIPKAGTFERYRCMEWLNYVATEIHKGMSPLWSDKTPPDYKNVVTQNLFNKFDYCAAYLKDHTYLMGNQFTVADIYLFTVLGWTKYLKMDMSKWPVLMSYVERVGTRPAVVATLKAEGLIK